MREITLWSPSGAAHKRVREGSALEVQLRRAGWRQFPPEPPNFRALTTGNPYRPCSCGLPSSDPQAADPSRHGASCEYRLAREYQPLHLGASETARQAREALEKLSPEDWIRDWGYVLCAALDETERSRGEVAARASAALDVVMAGTQAVKAVTEAATAWMMRTGWTAGKPALEPTRDRQAASEDLVRLLLDVTVAYMKSGMVYLTAPDALDARVAAVRGDPAARARASAILDELAREFPADVPAYQPLRDAIQRTRADLLGGSNVPVKDEDEEVPS